MPEDIIAYLMRLTLLVKLYHLRTESYSQHVISDSLYNNLSKNTDRMAEIFQGYTGMRLNLSIKEVNTTEDITDLVKKSRDYILTSRSAFEADIATIIDDIAAEMSLYLYKSTLK